MYSQLPRLPLLESTMALITGCTGLNARSPAADELMRAGWQRAVGENTTSPFKGILERHPDSPYRAEAESRPAAWHFPEAVREDSRQAYQRFLMAIDGSRSVGPCRSMDVVAFAGHIAAPSSEHSTCHS